MMSGWFLDSYAVFSLWIFSLKESGLLTRCCNPQTEALGDLSLLEKVQEIICQNAEQQPASL